jgi:hypothetical protein
MAPLLLIFNYHRFRATTIYPWKVGSFNWDCALNQRANLSKDKINMLFLGLRDPMNTKTISTIISIPTILQNGVLIIPMSKFREVSLEYVRP